MSWNLKQFLILITPLSPSAILKCVWTWATFLKLHWMHWSQVLSAARDVTCHDVTSRDRRVSALREPHNVGQGEGVYVSIDHVSGRAWIHHCRGYFGPDSARTVTARWHTVFTPSERTRDPREELSDLVLWALPLKYARVRCSLGKWVLGRRGSTLNFYGCLFYFFWGGGGAEARVWQGVPPPTIRSKSN